MLSGDLPCGALALHGLQSHCNYHKHHAKDLCGTYKLLREIITTLQFGFDVRARLYFCFHTAGLPAQARSRCPHLNALLACCPARHRPILRGH